MLNNTSSPTADIPPSVASGDSSAVRIAEGSLASAGLLWLLFGFPPLIGGWFSGWHVVIPGAFFTISGWGFLRLRKHVACRPVPVLLVTLCALLVVFAASVIGEPNTNFGQILVTIIAVSVISVFPLIACVALGLVAARKG